MIKVTCAIIRKNNKILVAKRSETMHLSCKWEFPGGKVENGESEIDCLIREIKEELNINIEPIKRCKPHIYDYKSFKIKLIPYLSNYLSGKLMLLEHKEAKWFEIDGLLNLDWAPADLPVLMDFLNLYNGAPRSL